MTAEAWSSCFIFNRARVPEAAVDFHAEEVAFALEQPNQVRQWIARIVADHGLEIESLTYIFCSDEYLHQINLEYLNHDTYTDIITFNNADHPDQVVEGDIFISIERVKENAESLSVSFTDELHRVLIHGVLHLLGYDDKDPASQAAMRDKEDSCLSLRNFS
jgi:probable rRNA maturation factor